MLINHYNMEDYILMYKTGEITLETLLELLGGYV